MYKGFLMTDMQMIREYFIQNNIELEGIDLIDELVKSKARKDEWRIMNMQNAVLMPAQIGYFTSKYAGAEADLLNRITLNVQINGKIPDNLLKQASKIVPKLMKPEYFWNDAIVLLGLNGIYFKNDTHKYTVKDLQNKKWIQMNGGFKE